MVTLHLSFMEFSYSSLKQIVLAVYMRYQLWWKNNVFVTGEATRVILMSLAIADMGSLLCNIFITLVPNSIHSYWTQVRTFLSGFCLALFTAATSFGFFGLLVFFVYLFFLVYHPKKKKIKPVAAWTRLVFVTKNVDCKIFHSAEDKMK